MKLKPKLEMVKVRNAYDKVSEGEIVGYECYDDGSIRTVKVIRVRGEECLIRELTILEKAVEKCHDIRYYYRRKPEMLPVTWGVFGLAVFLVSYFFE